jgi:hypothetical protein
MDCQSMNLTQCPEPGTLSFFISSNPHITAFFILFFLVVLYLTLGYSKGSEEE